MQKIVLKKLASGGLYLSGPNDTLPEGFMRRYRGVSALATDSIISRDGSTKLYDLAAHSLAYLAGSIYSGVSTSFYYNSTLVKSSLSGNDLAFSVMAPVAGGTDYLFVAGGGTLFKLDSDGNDYDWGITPPGVPPTLADGGAGGSLDDGGTYKYAVTFLNSVTGTRSNPNSPSVLAITANFKVLLHADGIDGSTTITNAISGGPAFTANGDAQIATYKSAFGGASVSFGRETLGTGYVNASDSADFYLSADFTISFFGRRWLTSISQGWFQQRNDDDNIVMFKTTYSGGSYTHNFLIRSAASELVNLSYTVAGFPNLGADYDYFALFAVERSGNVFRLYLNGVVVDSQTAAVSVPNLTGDFEIGRVNYGGATTYANAFVDEFVLINGTALYDGDYTPPTGPFGSDQITLAGGSTSIDLTDIPTSADPQVDVVELWRTPGDGTVYFKLIGLANGTTTYTDDIDDDDLQSLQLPTDNLKPYDYFDDCLGPWNGSMFWITRTQAGERGRLYYSPVGRAESVQGFINVTSDSDGLQRIVSHAGNLVVFSRSRAFQIYGTNPYYSREISGVLGTNSPRTIVVTPFGIAFKSQDGPRLFSGGTRAPRISYNQIKPIFRGRTVENLAAFEGTDACFARGEYIITDGTNTLAVDLETLVWRDLGIALDAIIYEPSTDQIIASTNSDIVDFEDEGTTQDVAENIALDVKTGEAKFSPPIAIEMIRIDANANGETISFKTDLNGTSATQGNLTTTAGRRITEFDLSARLVDRLALQFTASLTDSIEIFEAEIVAWPMVLKFIVNGQAREIPGRLSGDRQTLTFEDFADTNDTISTTNYVFENFFYDLNTINENVVVTLYPIGESSVALGTLNNASRTIAEIPLSKKGRFEKLTLAGDFTKAIELRRLEITAKMVP